MEVSVNRRVDNKKKSKIPLKRNTVSAENFFVNAHTCPHEHFKTKVIKRSKLNRKQHLNMLATPKGYYFELKKKKQESDESSDEDEHECAGDSMHYSSAGDKGAQKVDSCLAYSCTCDKCHDHQHETESGSLKPCDEKRIYLHNMLSTLWSYLTPDVIDNLKQLLMAEFGMKPNEAEEFMIDQRMISILGEPGLKPKALPCFPCPPKQDDFICPPCFQRPQKTNTFEFPSFPLCSPYPSDSSSKLPIKQHSESLKPTDTKSNNKSGKKIKNYKNKLDKSNKKLTLLSDWIPEVVMMVSSKITEYIEMMLTTKRTKGIKCVAETILKQFCELTGEECTMLTPQTTAQKIMVFLADRLAIWLAKIPCVCDIYRKEYCAKKEMEMAEPESTEEITSLEKKPKPKPGGKKKVYKEKPKPKPSAKKEEPKKKEDVGKKKEVSTKKEEPKKKEVSTKKVEPKKKEVSTKKEEPKKKEVPVKKKEPIAKEEPKKKEVSTTKKVPVKKEEPIKKDQPKKKEDSTKVKEPTKDEKATKEEPTKEEPTKEEPTKEEPTKEEPTKEEPTKEEPTIEEPTKEEPTKEEPSKEEPTKEEPTKEEPTKEELTKEVESEKEEKPFEEEEPTKEEESTKEEKPITEEVREVEIKEEEVVETAKDKDEPEEVKIIEDLIERAPSVEEQKKIDESKKLKVPKKDEILKVVPKIEKKGKSAFLVSYAFDNNREHYAIKEVRSNVVCTKVSTVRGLNEKKIDKTYPHKFSKQPEKPTAPLKVEDLKEWTDFTSELIAGAEHWNKWISTVCAEVEKGNEFQIEDLRKWKAVKQREALRWKLLKSNMKETAKLWSIKYSHSNK